MSQYENNSLKLQEPVEPVDPYPVNDPPVEPLPEPDPAPKPDIFPAHAPDTEPDTEPFPTPPEPIPSYPPDVIFKIEIGDLNNENLTFNFNAGV